MLFYGSIALGLLLSMAGLAYLFPSYGLKLLRISSSKFWELLRVSSSKFLELLISKLLKRMTPEQEAAKATANRMGLDWDPLRKKIKNREDSK